MPWRKFPWASLSDERASRAPPQSLRVTVEGTWLEDCLDDLHDELDERGLRIRPHAWISDEWFSPDNTPGIAIPFYLAHPRLMRLERKKIIDVEGGTRAECMRILRHEAGHVVQHAYQLQRRRRWQELFGRSSTRYPQLLPAQPGEPELRPASAALVRAKPSGRGFRRDLRGLAAAALGLAQALCRLAGAEEAGICRRADGRDRRASGRCSRAGERSIRSASSAHTLAEHYEKKQAHYAVDTPKTYDRDLHRIFSGDPRHRAVAGGFDVHPAQPRADPADGLASGPASTSSRSMPCSTK